MCGFFPKDITMGQAVLTPRIFGLPLERPRAMVVNGSRLGDGCAVPKKSNDGRVGGLEAHTCVRDIVDVS